MLQRVAGAEACDAPAGNAKAEVRGDVAGLPKAFAPITRGGGTGGSERGQKRKAEQAQRSAAAKAKREAFERRKAAEAAAGAAEAAIPKIGRHEARRRFGVSLCVWQRWEREGAVTCGYMVDGRKMYPVAEIERLLALHGTLGPAVEDVDREGVWRVPLGGRGIRRESMLVDEQTLKLLDGATCTVSAAGR